MRQSVNAGGSALFPTACRRPNSPRCCNLSRSNKSADKEAAAGLSRDEVEWLAGALMVKASRGPGLHCEWQGGCRSSTMLQGGVPSWIRCLARRPAHVTVPAPWGPHGCPPHGGARPMYGTRARPQPGPPPALVLQGHLAMEFGFNSCERPGLFRPAPAMRVTSRGRPCLCAPQDASHAQLPRSRPAMLVCKPAHGSQTEPAAAPQTPQTRT